jgi:hypothetical protein
MDQEIINEQIKEWEASKKGKHKGKVVAYYWNGVPVITEDIR